MLPAAHALQTGLGEVITEHLQEAERGRDALLRTMSILGHIMVDAEIAFAKVDECQRDLALVIAEHETATETHNLPEVRSARRLVQEAFARSGFRGTLEPLVTGFVDDELLHRRVEAAGQ